MKCKQCNKKMKGTKRKVFCSDKCRVYWNREKSILVDQDAVTDCDRKEIVLSEAKEPVLPTVKECLTDVVPGHKVEKSELPIIPSRHPKWQEGDPKEGSIAFYMKYDVYSYDEMD